MHFLSVIIPNIKVFSPFSLQKFLSTHIANVSCCHGKKLQVVERRVASLEILLRILKRRKLGLLMTYKGVESIDFGFGEVLTPKSSVMALKQQSEIRHTFNEWMQAIYERSKSSKDNQVHSNIPIRNNLMWLDWNLRIKIRM